MNIFNFSSEYKIERLQKRTDKALSMFTKTLAKLAKTNEKIELEKSEAVAKANEFLRFNDNLSLQRDVNDRIINKIKAIIED